MRVEGTFFKKKNTKKLFQKGGYRVVKRGVSCGKKKMSLTAPRVSAIKIS